MGHTYTEVAVGTLILVSVWLLVLEISYGPGHPRYIVLEQLGDGLTWAFVVELTIRGWAAPKMSV